MLAALATESDDALVLSWRAGNRSAGAEIFARYGRSVRCFLERRLGRDAGDEVQDVWAAVVVGIHRFQHRSSFRTFLFAIANNRVREAFRRRKRMSRVGGFAEDAIEDRRPDPVVVCEHAQTLQTLAAALVSLSSNHQLLVAQYYFERRTASEIGRMHGIPEDTARSRLRKAKATLHAYFSCSEPVDISSNEGDPIGRWLESLCAPAALTPREKSGAALNEVVDAAGHGWGSATCRSTVEARALSAPAR